MNYKVKICVIVGARPQFIKHAPLELALKSKFELITIHTGQHYDSNMSKVFFDELNIGLPHYMLNVGSSSHGKQTANMLMEIEGVLIKEKPNALLVYGDTNSTLAGALAASKLNIPIFHVEAGLRSFNKEMPEEINRILTDHVSELLFVPSNYAYQNLINEGVSKDKIHQVGDIMYDCVLLAKKVLKNRSESSKHILLTLHRPYNTDDYFRLKLILDTLNSLSHKIIFPIHPRTRSILDNNMFRYDEFENIQFCEPMSYFDMIQLQINSKCIITDSGGIQKEAYFNKIKCITLRSETEWIETLENGWNKLIFNDLNEMQNAIIEEPGSYKKGIYGYGITANEIAKVIDEYFYDK